MKYFSLFTGIGGFELGIQQAYEELRTENKEQGLQRTGDQKGRYGKFDNISADGFTCVGYSEIDKYAIQIYQRHFPNHKNYGDITKINEKELPDFDLLCGGFPCQSFSIAGKRGGFEDTRGTLFFEIARILKIKKPRLFLLENVKGLLSHGNGATFLTIITTLDELGYDLQWQVLNSKNFGVPQNRERVFIVGHLRGTPRPEVFPFGTSNEVNSKSDAQRDDLSDESSAQQKGNKSDSGNFIRRAAYSDDMRIRRLTPTECERLQGFPDGWTEGISDTQRYKCLGNAVTVNVVRYIVEPLI